MPELSIVIAAINAVGSAIPAFTALVEALKAGYGSDDQAEIDAALAIADAQADAQHGAAQKL